MNKDELDAFELLEYDADEWEQLAAMKRANPGGINYIRIPCIYWRLGVPDPIGSLCPDCRNGIIKHGN